MDEKKYIVTKPCMHCGCEHFEVNMLEDGTQKLTCWICGMIRMVRPEKK